MQPADADTDVGQAIALREWDEAWAQSRHLETMRAQYLGFFFTAVLAIIAFTAHQLADDGLRTAGSLLTVAALALGLHSLSTFLYLAVVRMNQVLKHYSDVIVAIRQQVQARHNPPFDLDAFTLMPRPPREGNAARITTTQGMAATVLMLGVIAFVIVLGVDAARALTVAGISPGTRALCGVAFISSIGVTAVARWALTAPQLSRESSPRP